MNRNPLSTVYQWQYLIELSMSHETSLQFHTMKYEELVDDLEQSIGSVLEFAGIPLADYKFTYKADLPQRIPVDQMYMHQHIEDVPHKDAAQKWERELKAGIRKFIGREAVEGIQYLGYPESDDKQGCLLYIMLKIRFKLQIILGNYYCRLLKIRSRPEKKC